MLKNSPRPKPAATAPVRLARDSDRRRFLRDVSVLVSAAALAPTVAWSRPIRFRQAPWAALNLAAFAELVETPFWVLPPGGGIVELQLRKVERLSSPNLPIGLAAGSRWEAFSLVFAGSATEALPQDAYNFVHQEMGQFNLFIVPIGPPEDEQHYQVVFNRPNQDPAPFLKF